MRGAGLRIPDGGFFLPAPRVFAFFFISEERVDIVDAHLFGMFGPDAVRTAEVRDAG